MVASKNHANVNGGNDMFTETLDFSRKNLPLKNEESEENSGPIQAALGPSCSMV